MCVYAELKMFVGKDIFLCNNEFLRDDKRETLNIFTGFVLGNF